MINKNIKDLINKKIKNAKKELLKTGILHMKVFMTDHHGKTTVLIIPNVPDDFLGKDLLAFALRHAVKKMDIRSVVLSMDCWLGYLMPDPEGYLRKHGRVADDPNKRETILTSYEDIDGNQSVVCQFYHRCPNGKIKFDEILHVDSDVTGRFFGLFEKTHEDEMHLE